MSTAEQPDHITKLPGHKTRSEFWHGTALMATDSGRTQDRHGPEFVLVKASFVW